MLSRNVVEYYPWGIAAVMFTRSPVPVCKRPSKAQKRAWWLASPQRKPRCEALDIHFWFIQAFTPCTSQTFDAVMPQLHRVFWGSREYRRWKLKRRRLHLLRYGWVVTHAGLSLSCDAALSVHLYSCHILSVSSINSLIPTLDFGRNVRMFCFEFCFVFRDLGEGKGFLYFPREMDVIII